MTSPGTTIVAFKAALLTQFKSDPAFRGVELSYGQRPGGRKEQVWLGTTSMGTQRPAGIRQGTKRRHEDYELEIYVGVVGRPNPERNEARAMELVAAIEQVIANPDQITTPVPGLLWATVQDVEWSTAETSEGPTTIVQITLNVRGNLL